MITNKRSNRIIFLDYLRIFAFMSVLIGHKFFAEITSILAMYKNHILHSNIFQMSPYPSSKGEVLD